MKLYTHEQLVDLEFRNIYDTVQRGKQGKRGLFGELGEQGDTGPVGDRGPRGSKGDQLSELLLTEFYEIQEGALDSNGYFTVPITFPAKFVIIELFGIMQVEFARNAGTGPHQFRLDLGANPLYETLDIASPGITAPIRVWPRAADFDGLIWWQNQIHSSGTLIFKCLTYKEQGVHIGRFWLMFTYHNVSMLSV